MYLAMSLDIPLTMQAAMPYIGYNGGNAVVNTVGYGFDQDIGYCIGYVIDNSIGYSIGYHISYIIGYAVDFANGYSNGYSIGYAICQVIGNCIGNFIDYSSLFIIGDASSEIGFDIGWRLAMT